MDTLGTTALPDGAIALSGTVLNFATAAFEELSGGGTLTQSGNNYTLDLGTFAHGGASATADLGVLNSAIGPADTLEGSFDLSGSGYGTAGFSAFSGITAGQSTDVGTVTFDPSSVGSFFETITLDPTGFNAAPFSGTLAPETLLVEAEVPCFARGTRIATPDGAVPVEDLRVGDAVIAHSGDALPIVWLGHRRVDCRRHPRPELVWPVRVEANAFAAGAPARDLWLSPDHAVFVDGVLIPIKHLINGATIAQVPSDEVTYWHVELPRHSVLLAEGLAAESYLDTGNRAQFVGGAAHLALHPDFTALGWDDACAPLCVDGPTLPAVKRRLIARLAQLGYRRMTAPDLHLVAKGQSIRAAAVKGRLHYFMLPSGTAEVRITSRSGRAGRRRFRRFRLPPSRRAHRRDSGWQAARPRQCSAGRRLLRPRAQRRRGVALDRWRGAPQAARAEAPVEPAWSCRCSRRCPAGSARHRNVRASRPDRTRRPVRASASSAGHRVPRPAGGSGPGGRDAGSPWRPQDRVGIIDFHPERADQHRQDQHRLGHRERRPDADARAGAERQIGEAAAAARRAGNGVGSKTSGSFHRRRWRCSTQGNMTTATARNVDPVDGHPRRSPGALMRIGRGIEPQRLADHRAGVTSRQRLFHGRRA